MPLNKETKPNQTLIVCRWGLRLLTLNEKDRFYVYLIVRQQFWKSGELIRRKQLL